MKDRILQEVKKFIEINHHPGRPLLLGFSGGSDSLALLHLLRACRFFTSIDLHVAHVDHGWRSESSLEAQRLKMEVDFPFYLCSLKGKAQNENDARKERIKFFSELYKKLDCQALFLGHHRDDQAETVLKRVLEGAHFLSLGGMRQITTLAGMTVWRPLLNIKKQELLDWVEKRGLKPILDSTNSDPRYLRSRMRVAILPALGRQFGKEIGGNLHHLGRTAQDLKEYLDRKIAPYFQHVQRHREGILIDLNPLYPFETIELKTFLKTFSDQENLALSRDALETLYELLQSDVSKRKIIARKKIIGIHRRTIALKMDSSY